MKKSNILVIGSLGVVVSVLIVFLFVRQDNHDLIFQLKHNAEIGITSIKLYGHVAEQPCTISLTNSETLNYMTRVLRSTTDDFVSGWVCRSQITLSNGKEFDVKLVVAQGGRSLAIGIERGIFNDEQFYGIRLVDTVPQELQKALLKLTSAEHMRSDQTNNAVAK